MSRDWTESARAQHPTNTNQGRDFKAWAKQIMFREQQGDKNLLAVQVTFAKMALDIPLAEKENQTT